MTKESFIEKSKLILTNIFVKGGSTEDVFDKIYDELVFPQADVSGRSEQLKAFLEWRDKQNILTLHEYGNDELIRCYEKSL